MMVDKRTRQLTVLCGIMAAWRGEHDEAIKICEALPELVPEERTRQQCENIFSILLDNRRLTQPSYSPCEALLETLNTAPPIEVSASINEMYVRG